MIPSNTLPVKEVQRLHTVRTYAVCGLISCVRPQDKKHIDLPTFACLYTRAFVL